MKCLNCGGDLDFTSDGKYRCPFCRKVFSKLEIENVPTRQNLKYGDDKGINVFDKNINGIAEITADNSLGSGFLIDKDEGLIITNAHVVLKNSKPASKVTVKIVNQNINADILVYAESDIDDPQRGVDLALLKLKTVPYEAVELKLENFDNVRTGEKIYIIGNSEGEGTCITSGIVSDKLRPANRQMLMMTDCPTNPGNSGGPVFNEKGKVIGVHVAGKRESKGMAYEIPSSTVAKFLKDFPKYAAKMYR